MSTASTPGSAARNVGISEARLRGIRREMVRVVAGSCGISEQPLAVGAVRVHDRTMRPELLTIADVGRRLHMKPWPVYELVEDGTLPAAQHHGRWLVRERDLDAYVGRLFGEPVAPALPKVALPDEMRTLISVKETAQHLDLTPASVYRLLDQLAIKSVYQGKRRSVVVASLRRYLDDLPIWPLA